MKKLIMATAFATILPVSFGAIAGEDMHKTHMQKDEVSRVLHQQFKADAKKLNLTSEQKTKISEIVKEHKKELKENIREELDDNQKQEFDKMLKEKKESCCKKE